MNVSSRADEASPTEDGIMTLQASVAAYFHTYLPDSLHQERNGRSNTFHPHLTIDEGPYAASQVTQIPEQAYSHLSGVTSN
jgi:hypothetical protein